MQVPFVSFRPMEQELNRDLHAAFDRVLDNSWYIDGKEDASDDVSHTKALGNHQHGLSFYHFQIR